MRISDWSSDVCSSDLHIPHFTYDEEIDVTALEVMRADLNANRGDRARLTLLPFLIVAICKAVPDFPMINAHYDDEAGADRKSVVEGKSVSVRVDLGGRRLIKKKKKKKK